METYLECIPCFFRQALEAAKLATEDEKVHENVLREVSRLVAEMELAGTPPGMGCRIHGLIRQLTEDPDPYARIKDGCNRCALELYPTLKERIAGAQDSLDAALHLAAAGNLIDSGANPGLQASQIEKLLEEEMSSPLTGSSTAEEFRAAVEAAGNVLYLADNAGEIILDRLLLEQLPLDKFTLAVKGGPVINDATMEDARQAGLTDMLEVIDNGSDAPGTILELCSHEFRRRFEEADLVISKGQGNYETLSDVPKNIFFLLKAKCPVISRHIGCEMGSLVLLRSQGHATRRATVSCCNEG